MTNISTHFDQFYQNIYKERWEGLKAALLTQEKQVARINAFAHGPPAFSPHEKVEWLYNSYWINNPSEIPRDEKGLLQYYVMDPASCLAAENLNISKGDRVLDMCAAPGGKSLVLAEALFAHVTESASVESGEVILNELSSPRRDRLIKVVHNYLPRSIRDRVWVTGQDANRFGLKQPESFDKILLDAPCSGERHLLENAEEFKLWKPKRSEGLAHKQYALLCSALLAAKPKAEILYSTCSISPLENDGVIAKALKKKGEQFLIDWNLRLSPWAEKTEYGHMHLPDRSGFGPIYFCKLIKQ